MYGPHNLKYSLSRVYIDTLFSLYGMLTVSQATCFGQSH
jgi:hypothetical protein